MERLRIRIPKVYVCSLGSCTQLTRHGSGICGQCRVSDTRVREEVPPAALPDKPKLVHRATLRGNLSC